MVLHNPNNWHWVNKDVSTWTKDWLETSLSTLSASLDDGKVTAKITKLVDLDGDVDVSQRKGKVITIFDFKLVLEYTGMALFDDYIQFISFYLGLSNHTSFTH